MFKNLETPVIIETLTAGGMPAETVAAIVADMEGVPVSTALKWAHAFGGHLESGGES